MLDTKTFYLLSVHSLKANYLRSTIGKNGSTKGSVLVDESSQLSMTTAYAIFFRMHTFSNNTQYKTIQFICHRPPFNIASFYLSVL